MVSAKYFSTNSAEGANVSALESLHTAVWSNTPPLARGSAVVSGARVLRRSQVWLEDFGERGKSAVSSVCGLCPILMPTVYLGPHTYVLLAQGSKGGFMSVAREAFKLLARNGLSKASYAILQARAFSGVRGIGGCAVSACIYMFFARILC